MSAHPTALLTCPVCAAPSVVEDRLKEVTLCRCGSCDHCFTDLNSLNGFEPYEAGYFDDSHRNWFLHPDLVLYDQLSRIITAHKPDASVLDIGCGTGNFLRYLRNANEKLSLTGVDTAPNPSNPGIQYLQGDFFDTVFNRQFDVLVSLAVIEHIPDVAKFAKRLNDLCVPGGIVITMTVDERSVIYRAARTLHHVGFSTPSVRLYDKHHLNHFTHSSLKRLLEENGFSTVHVIRHNTPMAAVDLPRSSAPFQAMLRAGIWLAFKIGDAAGKTMLQTIISRKGTSQTS
jgi:2-polyprenyl-3-methyl-5-hydroxy-6-metoxy-1,4-benzoquinol methylase